MTLNAKLITKSKQELTVLAMALHTQIHQFPRLYAVVELPVLSQADIKDTGATLQFTLVDAGLTTASNTLLECMWYLEKKVQLNAVTFLLTLCADPVCFLTLRSFALNKQNAQDILTSKIGTNTLWEAPQFVDQKIEALVSHHETFEELADRVAGFTDDVFSIRLNAQKKWVSTWAPSARVLLGAANQEGDASEFISTSQVKLWAQMDFPLEPVLQKVGLSVDFNAALLTVSTAEKVWASFPPVQLGKSGLDAVAHLGVEGEGEALKTLQAQWYEVQDAPALPLLWQGKGIELQTFSGNPTGNGKTTFVVSSLFLFEGQTENGRTAQAVDALRRHLSLLDGLPSSHQGWAAFALAIPLDTVPKDKTLLRRLVKKTGIYSIWESLISTIGCGQQALARYFTDSKPLVHGPLPAIVLPPTPGGEVISRTADGFGYLGKIWVRILGIDGTLEVDWATPFACEGGDGDLALVPTQTSLGYVHFIEGRGAPFFFAMSHYKNTPISSKLNLLKYKHGLVTTGSMLTQEVQGNWTLEAKQVIYQISASLKREVSS